eukprot:symbB.v1.2.028868.t1/scaffold3026.1/size65065/3
MELCDGWHHSRQSLELAGVLKDWDEFSKVLKYHSLVRRHLDEEARKELLDSFVFVMFYYVLTLFCKRASSMSKFTSPPEIYSKILSSDEEEAEMTLANILSDWRTLLLLEQSKYQELASDLNLTVSKPVRLAFTFFEAGKTDAAIGIMKSMLLVVPDTKLIEDIHQKVRVDSGANANLNQSCAETQNIIRNSGLLEARGIPHTAQINRVTFLARPKPKLVSDSGIVIHDSDIHFEHVIKACLRSWSTELVFKDLAYLAGIMEVPNPNSFGRLDLVKAIADKFEDSEFTKEVCKNEELKMTKKKKTTDHDGEMPDGDEEEMPDEEDEFAELLIAALDKDEAEEFRKMRKRINNRFAGNKKRKWAVWKQEALDAPRNF